MSKYVKICKKKGTWKGGNNFTLSPENVHQVALFYTTSLNKTSPADNYISKVNNRNTRTRSKICSKLPIKTPQMFERVLEVSLAFISFVGFTQNSLFLVGKYLFKVNSKDSRKIP